MPYNPREQKESFKELMPNDKDLITYNNNANIITYNNNANISTYVQ